MLFERSSNEFKFGRNLKGRNKVIEDLTRPNSLFLSAAAQNNHEELGNVADFFRRFHVSGLTNIQPRNISSRLAAEDLPQKAIEVLKDIEVGVTDFKVDEWPSDGRFEIFKRPLQNFVTGYPSRPKKRSTISPWSSDSQWRDCIL